MATKDERPGLLSKVAMFVRNPTKDWSELDAPETTTPTESEYDRNALKAMIERRRQNDFVRRREFDQLRRLRNRAPGTPVSAVRPSFFQSSLPFEDEGRSVTLKKIDEIEAQMSRQWWKGRQGSAEAVPGTPLARPAEPAADGPGTAAETDDAASPERAFAPTEVMGASVPPPVSDFASTQTVSNMAGLAAPAPAAPLVNTGLGFSMDQIAPATPARLEADPELEEAAILFANGDDAGAEQCLRNALGSFSLEPQLVRNWAHALLDLHCATGNRAGFERASEEYALVLDGLTPQWVSLPERALSQGSAPSADAPLAHAFTWQCPGELDGEGMQGMRDALLRAPPPWLIDWSPLRRLDVSAMPLLNDFFQGLCEDPVTVRFFSGDVLVQLLRHYVASGDETLDHLWWSLRLAVLRVMRLQDDFEIAALDYCVNLGVAPPLWMPAACVCQELTIAELGQTLREQGLAALDTRPQESDADASGLSLQGELQGDAAAALAAMDAYLSEAAQIGPLPTPLVVRCDALLRVDFAAAGSLLNWVVQRQADGLQVQFSGVHRLVAAFFCVIGIQDSAQIVLRRL